MTATLTRDEQVEVLTAERRRLIRTKDRSTEQTARLDEVTTQLLAVLAIPPDGYALPKAAADLIATARTNGWLASLSWSEDSGGAPFVTVEVGRTVTPGTESRGTRWHYKATWHNRGQASGVLRLFGRGLACTPDSPQWGDCPSVKRIQTVVVNNPVQAEGVVV